MALPASGTISMDMIRAELGIPAQVPFDLYGARYGAYVPLNPYSITPALNLASWYNYCHTCTPLYSFTIYTSASHPGSYGWYTANDACTGTRSYPLTVYSSSSTLTTGSTLYFLSGGLYYPLQVNLFVGQTELWLYDGSGAKPFRLTSDSSNVIAAVSTCITCTEYYNYQSYDIFVYWNDCLGNAQSGYIGAGQSWCAQDGTVSGDPGWGSIGTC